MKTSYVTLICVVIAGLFMILIGIWDYNHENKVQQSIHLIQPIELQKYRLTTYYKDIWIKDSGTFREIDSLKCIRANQIKEEYIKLQELKKSCD